MRPGRRSLVMDKGATFEITFVYRRDGELVDLTGWGARAQVRQRPDTAALITFDANPAAPERNAEIVLGDDGSITLRASSTLTDDLVIERGIWSLELTDPARPPGMGTWRILEGDVLSTAEVTR